jgi:PAS domain S-box-containing protein
MNVTPEPGTPPLRVLLVEDDPDDVLLCHDAIARSNLNCRVAVTGTLREAAACMERDGADMALVDLSLPDAEQLEAVTALARRFADLPIVVLTGLLDEETAARALHAGAEDYLVKGSGSRDSFGRAVRYAIERKRGEQARRAKDAAEAARTRAERSARELERNYRQLFDCSPYPMYVLDTDTLAFLEINDAAAAFYGHPRQALLGQEVTRLCLPEDVAALTNAIAAATTAQRWGPLRQVKHDGTVVDVTITSHMLSFDGRDACCMVIEDITEREQLERRLRQSQRLESLGQLAGGVAHDFNNLLGIILGYATMCAQEVEESAQTDPRWRGLCNDLAQILQAGDRAANLTRQLLSFARAEITQTQVIDLNTVVTGVEELLRRTIDEDIRMNIDLTRQSWPVEADPGQVEQVLLNLVVNARDAMPSGGVLTIATDPVTIDENSAALDSDTPAGRYMRLRVTDTGTGMSQATIDRAFEPFFTTKPKGQGTGLGLATIYGIVTQAGGQVHIDSRPGAGTTITALLPATHESAKDTDPEPPEHTETQHHVRYHETILLAEDEHSLRIEAIDAARQYPGGIDLLLTDVVMPHMNGHDLAIRLHATHPTLPVIYMSGYAEPLLAARTTLPAGVTLLSKPIVEQHILAVIRHTLDSRSRHATAPGVPRHDRDGNRLEGNPALAAAPADPAHLPGTR